MTRSVCCTQMAVCNDCGKEWSGRNAHGVAARHARASGHEVYVHQELSVTYNPADENYRLRRYQHPGF